MGFSFLLNKLIEEGKNLDSRKNIKVKEIYIKKENNEVIGHEEIEEIDKINSMAFLNNKIELDVNNVYIDLSFIHSLVIEENPDINSTTPNVYNLLIEKTIEKLEEILKPFGNQSTIHIFFESTSSIAKLNKRINKKIMNHIKEAIDTELSNKTCYKAEHELNKIGCKHLKFNSRFMQKLKNKIVEHKFLSKAFVHFYDPNDPDNFIGEADHKILKYIIKNEYKINSRSKINYIISNDSDLISIAIYLTNYYLESKGFRFNTIIYKKSGDTYKKYIFDTLKLINFIWKAEESKKNIKDMINDFIFVINFMGNDFIPGLYSSSVNDLDKIIKKINMIDGFIIEYKDSKFKINKQNLIKFLEKCDEDVTFKNFLNLKTLQIAEQEYIIKNYNKILYETINDQFNFGNYICQHSEINTSYGELKVNRCKTVELHGVQKYLHSEVLQFRVFQNKNYATVKLNDDWYKIINIIKYDNSNLIEQNYSSDSDSNNNFIKNYLEGLDFVVDLYFNSNISDPKYFWYYKYMRAPKIGDIVKYLESNNLPSHMTGLPDNSKYLTPKEADKYVNIVFNKNIQEINQTITYDNVFGTNYSNRILFTYGINNFRDAYLRNRYFLDPIIWKNSLNLENSSKIIKKFYVRKFNFTTKNSSNNFTNIITM